MLEKLRNYVASHKELQVKAVTLKAMEDCAKACGCDLFRVMYFLRYGK